MKSESPLKWAISDDHHNVVHRCLPHQIVHLHTDHIYMQSSKGVKLSKQVLGLTKSNSVSTLQESITAGVNVYQLDITVIGNSQ